MKVYFDTNVILDWALQRELFEKPASLLINAIEAGKIEGYVSVLAMANVHYFVRQKFGRAFTHEFLLICQTMFQFIDNPATALTQANEFPYKDFEDDLHFYSALPANLKVIVTRNGKDFRKDAPIEILSPIELLEKLNIQL